MANNSDNPADPFKKALAEATKVMANDPDLTINYTVDPSGISGDSIRLPQISRRMSHEEVLIARGTSDALALYHRYHNEKTHTRYLPEGGIAKDIYEAMETARCEALGARDMPGTASNIDAKIGSETDSLGYRDIKDRSDAPLAAAAGFLVRNLATGRELPEGAQNVLNLWRDFLEDQAGKTIGNISEQLEDQSQFAKFVRQVITDLGYGDQLGKDPDNMDDEDDEQFQDETDEDENPESTGEEENQEEDLSLIHI